jgi:ribosomal protein L35
MKTNKSFSKRIKVSKHGALTTRMPGQNHFNAKESRRAQLGKRRTGSIILTQRAKRRFIPGSTVA